MLSPERANVNSVRKHAGGLPPLVPGERATVVAVRVPSALRDALEEAARLNGRSVSEEIRQALAIHLVEESTAA